jgi:hypothetical protein
MIFYRIITPRKILLPIHAIASLLRRSLVACVAEQPQSKLQEEGLPNGCDPP